MLLIRLMTATALISCATASFAKNKEVSLRDRQQEACYDDAQRLCGDLMPDVDQVEACMKPKKAQVSAKCRAFYD